VSLSLLIAAGEALYGPRWQSALADDLNVATRTVQRWVAGDRAVPDLRDDLRVLLHVRKIEITDLLKHL
jgi:hypothetical protein